MYNEVDKKERLHNDVRFNVAYVADVFPFRAGRGNACPNGYDKGAFVH